MNISNRFGRISLIFVAWCCLSASNLVAQSDTTLGSGGELYRARTGAYKDLFPGQKPPAGVDPASSALALDVERPGVAVQRFFVPSTGGNDVELLPSLIYEDAASTVYLLWERRVNNIHPVLMLTGFSKSGFSNPIELISDSFSDKTHPQLALTRDHYQVTDATGAAVSRSRTVLHILWAQDDNPGVDTFYSPVIFEEGAYIGWNPVYRLNDLDNSPPATLGYPISARLLHSPILEAGQDGRTVTMGFIAPGTSKLLTVEIDALPAALSQIADKTRGQIIETGRKSNLPNLQDLASRVRTAILTVGASAFRPEVLQAIADQTSAAILASSPQQSLQSIADTARAQVIDTGAKFAGRGLRSFGDDATAQLAEVDAQDGGGEPSSFPSQIFQLRMTSSRAVPNVGSGPGTGETRLFVSETGERAIASWLDVAGNQIFYRMSDDGTWSDPLVLKLSSSLTLKDAYGVLDQRVRSH
jgi:hypothetical protein